MTGTGARAEHWDAVYGRRDEAELSWYEDRPELSLSLISEFGDPAMPVIDIGGGLSRLADHLLEAGFGDITVLDLSRAAIAAGKARLGTDRRIRWIVQDITRWRPERIYGLWHDRAVFHFLTDGADRAAYVAAMRAALAPGGHAIIATFAEDGPEKCSGLPVRRYAPDALAAELDLHAPGGFMPVAVRRHRHVTPQGVEQSLQVSVFGKTV